MNKVLITGDSHGDLTIDKLRRLQRECDEGKIHLTKADYVIICGDFGLLWNYEPLGRCVDSNTKDWCWNDEEIKLFNWYNGCPWTTLFVDG